MRPETARNDMKNYCEAKNNKLKSDNSRIFPIVFEIPLPTPGCIMIDEVMMRLTDPQVAIKEIN